MANIDIKTYNNNLLKEVKRNDKMLDFIDKHKFSDDYILAHINVFKDASDSLNKCKNCKGLYTCTQKKKGEYISLDYDGVLLNEVAYCDYELARRKLVNIKKNYVYSDIPDEYLNIYLEDVDREEKTATGLFVLMNDILDEIRKKGLYIYGDFGVGKTYMCYALLNSLVRKGKKVAFVKTDSFVDIMRKLCINNNDEYSSIIEKLKKVDYLVFDDLGSEKVSAFSRDDILFNILDYRMENKKMTIFNSNLGKKELLNAYQYDKDEKSSLLKAKRLLERIDILADDYVLSGTNKRRMVTK